MWKYDADVDVDVVADIALHVNEGVVTIDFFFCNSANEVLVLVLG